MNSDINTNRRLFDLVRFMRSELHEADLITDEEYSWLLSEAPMAKGGGSPSPRRLEDYDRVKASYLEALEMCERSKNTAVNKWVARLKVAEDALRAIMAHDGPGFPAGTCAEIARVALDSENDQCSRTRP